MEFQVHGALVEALEVGVLLRGPSGVGKSECALELVQRGHRLVADDIVRLATREGDSGEVVIGRAQPLIRHYIEIRGIGLLHVRDLYGASAVRDERRVDLVCDLEPWREEVEYERIGLDRPREILAGVAIPRLTLPVRPARNMATLVEVAVRDHLQRRSGVNAAKRLDEAMRRQSTGADRGMGV